MKHLYNHLRDYAQQRQKAEPCSYYEKTQLAAWQKANGKIPDGMTLSAACGNTRCTNLKHLYLTATNT